MIAVIPKSYDVKQTTSHTGYFDQDCGTHGEVFIAQLGLVTADAQLRICAFKQLHNVFNAIVIGLQRMIGIRFSVE